MTHTRITQALALALGLSACNDPTLASTRVPDGAHLEMTKKATLKVTASAAGLGTSGTGTVEVRRVDGPTLYWGALTTAAPADIEVNVPSYQTAVDVVLHTKGSEPQTARVALDAAGASHNF